MANPAVRSVSSGQNTSVSSVVCTHSAGLTAGDLMVLFVGTFNGGSDRSINTPSGWTVQQFITGSNDFRRNLIAFKKVATAGDVSAGSTTVTFSGSVEHTAFGFYAITGAASGNEITISDGDFREGINLGTTVSFTSASTPLVEESLAVVSFYNVVQNPGGVVTGSGYSITPSATFTERADIGDFVAGSVSRSLQSATAPYNGLTEITAYGFVQSASGSTSQDTNGILLLVNAPQSPTADVGRLDATPTLHDLLGSNTATADVSRIDIVPELHGVSAKSSSQATQWTNETKLITTWTNEQK